MVKGNRFRENSGKKPFEVGLLLIEGGWVGGPESPGTQEMVSVVGMVASAVTARVSKDLSVTVNTTLAPLLPVIPEAPVHCAEQEIPALKSEL